MAERRVLSEAEVENIVGGAFVFNGDTLTYYHDDGSVSTYHIVDYDNAWYSSNKWHAKNYREDDILQALLDRGYIE